MIRSQLGLMRSLLGVRMRDWGFGLAAAAATIMLVWLGIVVGRIAQPTTFQAMRALATAISIPAILIWFHNRELLTGRLREFSKLIIPAVVAVFAIGIGTVIYQNLTDPAEWDFLVFWLDGYVGTQGANFYDPLSYQSVSLPFSHSSSFAAEILEVGFRYPPLSMLILMPLGYFDITTSMAFWYAAQGLIMAISIVVLWKLFLASEGFAGLAMATALVFVVAGTISTFKFAQTNFLALLLLLMFWKDRERTRGGVWLILAAYVKPFLLALLLYPILRKNVRALLAALTTVIITSAISIVIFGPETFLAFIVNNPAGRMPDSIYIQISDQSLLSTIIRLSGFAATDQSPLLHPLYLIFAVIMTTISSWLVFHLGDENAEWGFALLLLLALLLYPASYFSYRVLLVAPLLLLWVKREELPGGTLGVGALATAILVLVSFAGMVFFAYLLMWVAFSINAAGKVLSRGREQSNYDRESQTTNVHMRAAEQNMKPLS